MVLDYMILAAGIISILGLSYFLVNLIVNREKNSAGIGMMLILLALVLSYRNELEYIEYTAPLSTLLSGLVVTLLVFGIYLVFWKANENG